MPETDLDFVRAMPATRSARRTKERGRWPQSESTKVAILEAAAALFQEYGYDATTINDIVARSGISVGSIYHQFGGKAEVFVALAERLQAVHAAASIAASEKLAKRGETDPVELYIAGARAYLLSMWKLRSATCVVISDDSPPGFGDVNRSKESTFVHAAQRFTIGKPPLPDSSALAVTSLIQAAANQLVQLDDARIARGVAEYFTNLVRVLAHATPSVPPTSTLE